MLNSEKVKFACAPINWTNDDLPALGGEVSFEQCVSEIALAGYEGTEIGTKFPKDLDTLKEALKLRQLSISNQWFSSEFTSKPKEDTIAKFIKQRDYLHELGTTVIGVGECGVTIHGDESKKLFKERPYLTEKQFEDLAEGLNEIGRLAQEKDMQVVFHYHIGSGIENLEEIDKLMEMTDPSSVKLLYDTGHAVIAGEDPINILNKYIDRIGHIHVKDVRKEVFEQMVEDDLSFLQGIKKGLFTVPGDGNMVDMEAVFDILNKSNYEGWIVVEAEQDPRIANPLEYAIKARDYIREQTGL